MKKHFLLAGFAALMLFACNNKPVSELTLSGLDPAKFQTEVNNTQTNLYTLKNKAGMEVCITNFGGVYHGTGQKRKDAGCSFRLR